MIKAGTRKPNARPAPHEALEPWRRRLLLTALLCLLSATRLWAVSVSPNALYIDHRTRTASLTLFNPGTRTEDIDISFAFGYPQSDSAGQVGVPLLAMAPEGEPSAVEWLRAFPRRLRLAPGQRQVVRILAQPPANLPDGEYWARVLITSRGGQAPVEQSQGSLTMQIAMETVIVTAVTYRKGTLSTDVSVTPVTGRVVDGGAEVTLDLTRLGTAAFLGRMVLEVIGPDGARLGEVEEGLAVYRTLRRRVVVPVAGGIPAGSSVRYRVDTTRPDLPDGGAIPAAGASGTVALEVP